MKSFKVQASLLLLAMSLLLSASAHGDQFNVFANATTFWDTLTVRTDPGVSITWLGTSNLTSCGQNLDGTVGVGGQSIPNWNPVSLSTQIGGLAAFGEATTQNLSSTLDWTAYPPAGTSEMGCLRQGNFLVTGSGNVTFTIDYSLAANRLVNASSLPYPRIETSGVMEADLLLFIPFVQGLSNSQNFMFLPHADGSVNDSLSQTGMATASSYLTNGQTYWIRADSDSFVSVVAPEPSSLALLGFGLFGMVLGTRGRNGLNGKWL